MGSMRNKVLLVSAVGVVFGFGGVASANPYNNPGPFAGAVLGDPLLPPHRTPGKEYSHFEDRDAAASFDLEQVIAWDGLGGVVDAFDFSGSRPGVTGGADVNREVDAIAHANDALFRRVISNQSGLLYSVSSEPFSQTTGPLATIGGLMIGGSGEVSSESLAGSHAIWAKDTVIDLMNPPRDVDGLEIWGPEPKLPDPDVSNLGSFDTNRYSTRRDIESGFSVWAYEPGTNTSIGFITQPTIAAAVISLLGDIANIPDVDVDDFDVDALMVSDKNNNNEFDRDGTSGEADQVLFSIRQLPSTAIDGGFYATGAEIFVLDSIGNIQYLRHGGHLWNRDYGLNFLTTTQGVQLDVNAIESIGIPEPASAGLLVISGLMMLRRRR